MVYGPGRRPEAGSRGEARGSIALLQTLPSVGDTTPLSHKSKGLQK